ncbi:MAG: ABC transporter permease [Phycisphaerae bacterium]
MRHWSQLATRNWRAKRVRTIGAVLAIALGTGAVVWVTCCYESVRQTVLGWAGRYVGASHITLESPLGKYDTIPQSRLIRPIVAVPEVERVVVRLVRRLRGEAVGRDAFSPDELSQMRAHELLAELDIHGIEPANELAIRDHRQDLVAGRMLEDADESACVLEAAFAEDAHVGLGDKLLVWGGSRAEPYELEIVGLVNRRKVGRFQRGLAIVLLPVLQKIDSKQGSVTSIDVVVRDATRARIQTCASRVLTAARRIWPNVTIRTAEIRMRQIEQAQQQQEFVLILLSCVAMLTALFIILSTLSMGMIERIGQLGLMRCIGVTGAQLASLVLIEVVPMGLAGIALGIPIGLGLTALTVRLVPEYLGELAVSRDGIALAAIAGMATTLAAAALPALAALRVSPLEAARPRARRASVVWLYVALLLAVIVLGIQHTTLVERLARSTWFAQSASTAVVMLYLGYALASPLAVWAIGSASVVVVAWLLRVRVRLLQDQIGHAVWRSSGICCGLMVGLSLIVGLVVFNESFTRGWQFPKQFPEAYIWNFEQMTPDARAVIAAVPGVREFTVFNAQNVIVEEKPLFMEQVFRSVTWFMACEPESFFDLVKVEFVEGSEQAARELLAKGDHVVIAEDFARARNKHLGDTVRVFVGQNPPRDFRIAGVMQSPALDIAAGYFQAQSEANVVATGSVLGTVRDLERYYNIRGTKLVLLNFDLPQERVPTDWPPKADSRDAIGMPADVFDDRLALARRWQRWREELVLRDLKSRLNAVTAFSGTARELKDEIDVQLSRVTGLLTAVPAVALIVAAIGVANLMTANVTSRAKQLAVLRAVGATKGLVLRLVVGEALVLGLLGSGLGLALGLHLAANTAVMVDRMWGMRISIEMPWGYVSLAIGLTVGLCVLAGILPARHAARTNIVDALHVA